jgi:hypothetical protein
MHRSLVTLLQLWLVLEVIILPLFGTLRNCPVPPALRPRPLPLQMLAVRQRLRRLRRLRLRQRFSVAMLAPMSTI